MNRNDAIDLARAHALAHGQDHAYLPTTDAEAAEWLPHSWVVDAIVAAVAGLEIALRIKGEESDCCAEDIQKLRAAVIGLLEIEAERIKTGAFKPNAEAQRRIDAAWAAL